MNLLSTLTMTVLDNLYQEYQHATIPSERIRLAFEIGQHEFIKGNIPVAIQFAQDILALIDTIPDTKEYFQLKGDGYSHVGFMSNLSGNVMLSLEQLQKAENYYQQISNEASLADVAMRLGSAHWNIGNYEKGLNYALKAVKDSERVGEKRVFAFSTYLIASYFWDLKDYEQAEKYYQQSLKAFEDLGEQNGIGRAINGLANVFYLKGEHQIALSMLQKALAIHLKEGNWNSTSRDYNDLGKVYTALKDYPNAFGYYGKALEIRLQKGYLAAGVTTLSEIGELHLSINQITEAQIFLERAEQEAKKINANAKLFRIHQLLSKVFKEQADFDKALFHLEKYIELKEAALSDEGLTRIKNLEVQYKVEKSEQEAEIYRLRNVELKSAYDLIEQKNNDITASINYAQRIQKAFSSREEFNNLFPESFVFYRPRDIVSGDFSWTTKVKGKKILVVADCTGHGVPGAIMTVLGRTLLKSIVEERAILDPAQILNALDQDIRQTLHQDTSNTQDGMDAAIVVIDEKTNTLEFAGAKLPLVLFQKGKLIRIKGSVFSIGGKQLKQKTFQTHRITYQKGSRLYLFSDGFQDQFGGEYGRKFMSKNLLSLLETTTQYRCTEQYAHIGNAFDDWKGIAKQTDDVILIGLEL